MEKAKCRLSGAGRKTALTQDQEDEFAARIRKLRSRKPPMKVSRKHIISKAMEIARRDDPDSPLQGSNGFL